MPTDPIRVFRCLKARRWDAGAPFGHLPAFDPISAGRWNSDDQWALYTSHSPDVAVDELRKHLPLEPAVRSVLGSILAAIPAPLDYEVVVLRLDVPDAFDHTATLDGRILDTGDFDGLLEPCGDARDVAASLIADGYTRLIVPSVPRPGAWNSVLFYFGNGQPGLDDLPDRHAVEEVGRETVTPAGPECP